MLLLNTFFECSLKSCTHLHTFLNNYAVHVYFRLSTSEMHCTNYMQVRRLTLIQQNREKRTYLYNTWEKVWVEMWPVNPSNIDNNFNKLVSDVWWQLLVIWQQIIIEKMTDLSLISSLCSYPLFINEILWYRNQINDWLSPWDTGKIWKSDLLLSDNDYGCTTGFMIHIILDCFLSYLTFSSI